LIEGVLRSAREHDVPHELMSIADLAARFPRYAAPDNWAAVFEPGAGFLRPEEIITTHLELARQRGAEIVTEEAVSSINASGNAYRVATLRREVVADRVVVAAGAWTAPLVPELQAVLRVERQVSHWFASMGDARLGPEDMPVTMWELDDGRIFYTTPDVGEGVKAGFHHGGEMTTADTVRREVAKDEVAEARSTLGALVPLAAGTPGRSAVCLYTDTPDEHFIVDRHPAHRGVVIVSACSGHGFKFSSAVGEIAADLVQDADPRFDLAPFALARFGPA
jgi:sarcosine oxidase